MVILSSFCGGFVFVFVVLLIGTEGYWVGEVYYVVFLVYVGAVFPLVTLMLFPLSFKGTVELFQIFSSSRGLVGESPFLNFYPPLI